MVNPVKNAKLVRHKNVNSQFAYIKTNDMSAANAFNALANPYTRSAVAKSIAPAQDMLGTQMRKLQQQQTQQVQRKQQQTQQVQREQQQQVQHEQQQRQQLLQQMQLQMMPNPMFAYSGMMMPNMGISLNMAMSPNMGMSLNMGMLGMFPFAQFQFSTANGVNMPVAYSNMNPNMNPVNSNMNPMNRNVNPTNAMNPSFGFQGQQYGDHGN